MTAVASQESALTDQDGAGAARTSRRRGRTRAPSWLALDARNSQNPSAWAGSDGFPESARSQLLGRENGTAQLTNPSPYPIGQPNQKLATAENRGHRSDK